MATTLDRFAKDLDDLMIRGNALRNAMIRAIMPAGHFKKQLEQTLSKEEADEFIKLLPNFNNEYQSWYSECLALLKQLLPDRVDNFISLYEKPKVRKQLSHGNYVIHDYLQGLQVGWGSDVQVGPSSALPQLDQQIAILSAAKARFKSSLFEVKQLVQADLFDSEIDAARGLFKGKFYRAAGVIVGVVLEKHLHQVCVDRGVKIAKKNPTLSDLSEALKANATIDVPQWRHLTLLADIRNICAHHKQQEPTPQQVCDLIDGAEKVLKTIV